ncbi:MAG: TonB family protein [Polyangiales bacterium]
MRFGPATVAITLIAGAASATATAHADDGKPTKSLVAPRVKERLAPRYPDAQLPTRATATVVVELRIDATGAVTDARVVESGGSDFDDSALATARLLRFEPATRDAAPIAAVLRWRFRFEPPPIEPATTTTTTTTTTATTTTTTATTATATATATATTTDEPATPMGDDIVIKGARPPREVTKRVLDQQEIERIPGDNGDAIRSVLSMPGVARPPGLLGLLLVRGSAPQDSEIFVDGTLVPLIYHFGGLSSAIPTELVEKLDFYPGNFGPEYGRVMGGILDIGVRSPKRESISALLQVDLVDARAVFEGKLDDKTRFAISGRRSWIDAWLGPVLRSVGTGVSTAPVYYDWQALLERDLTPTTTARLFLFGSDDRLALTLAAPSDSDPSIGGALGAHTGFLRLQARTQTIVSPGTQWTNMLSVGRDVIDFNLGGFLFTLDSAPIDLRSDLRAKLSREAFVVVGLDARWSYYDVTSRFPANPGPDQDPGPFFAQPTQTLKGTGALFRPGAYAMLDLEPIRSVKILPGIRVDYSRDTASWDLSPRLSLRWSVHDEFPKTTLKGGVGLFFQPPQPQESLLPFGTLGLRSNRATHYDVGFEQELTRQLDVSLDGFYKDLQSLVVLQPNIGEQSGITYANTGSGRVYGAELLVRYRPDDLFFGWIAYTLSRSERRDTAGGPTYTFDWDQTHILTVLGSFKLGRGWEVGARFRYVTGTSYTPDVGGVVDFDAGAYAAIQSYPYNTARLPAFSQLDVRLDKQWTFAHWKLRAYLDIQNILNRTNAEGINFNYNYSQTGIIGGVPFLPVLGLRAEL